MTSTKFHSQPLFTRRQLTALLLPLIAEQALSVTIGLADTLMVSSVGEAAVSGVSLVDTFNTLMIQIMSALATGGAVVASQYIGHREEKNARASAAQILFILSVFSLAVAAVVVARDDVSEDDVYNICYTIFENMDNLAHDNAGELDVEFASGVTAVPYHAGAAKYFAEKGFDVPTK